MQKLTIFKPGQIHRIEFVTFHRDKIMIFVFMCLIVLAAIEMLLGGDMAVAKSPTFHGSGSRFGLFRKN